MSEAKSNTIEEEQANIHSRQSEEFDLTSTFATAKLKKLLYNEEPKMAKISVSSLELIGTSSAFFLKDLIQSSLKSNDKEDGFVTLDHVRTTVDSNPSLELLKEPLEGVQNYDTTETYKEYEPANRKRKASHSVSGGGLLKKGEVKQLIEQAQEKEMEGGDNEVLHEAIRNAAKKSTTVFSDDIVADESDYD